MPKGEKNWFLQGVRKVLSWLPGQQMAQPPNLSAQRPLQLGAATS